MVLHTWACLPLPRCHLHRNPLPPGPTTFTHPAFPQCLAPHTAAPTCVSWSSMAGSVMTMTWCCGSSCRRTMACTASTWCVPPSWLCMMPAERGREGWRRCRSRSLRAGATQLWASESVCSWLRPSGSRVSKGSRRLLPQAPHRSPVGTTLLHVLTHPARRPTTSRSIH